MSFIRFFIPLTFEIKKTMLVTTADEIRAYLPTSVYSGDDSLLALMEDTEESVLVPVLGRELYEKVCEDYEKAVEEYGGVTPQVIAKEDLTPEIRLIRHCQLPVVYLTLANSTGILSVNLNEGGGLNQSYTEMFDNADKDAVGRFERDAWFKGHRGIDRLLLFLENDARSKAPVFAELWHKSRYFYFQGDLLFTTAETMSRYLDIGGSREKFIALLPDIRYCQQSYIAPSIGEGMTETLVGWCTGKVKPQAETDEDGGDAVVNTDIFAGEWQETREECYMSYGDELAYSNKNTKSVWLLNSDGYFYCISSGSGNCAGSWKHNGEILTVNAGNWEVTRRTISYLDTDSFCVKMDYTYDTFYLNYFRRLSYGAEVTASMEQFVGTWNMNDGEHNDWYWLFSPNGNLYIGRENISSDRYYYKGKWSYAPASKILVTNLNYDNVPSDLLPDPHFDPRVFMW